jgi:succinate-semialdehyde dehydrogenase/glutarate-semialdehyde dehydrogenase
MEVMRSVSPIDGRELARYEMDGPAEVERKLALAAEAARRWPALGVFFMERILCAVAATLRTEAPRLALLATEEMGKPIREARAEVEKCALGLEHFARRWREPRTTARPKFRPDEARTVYVRHDPLGVVLAVMPWNFPYWQVVRCACCALAAGNALLVKHAPNVQGCAEALAGVFARASDLPGLFQNLRVDVGAVAGLLGDRRVAAATFTGSVRAGRAVAAAAGAAGKKCVLELGGSDPFVVLADADLEAAAATAVASRFQNAGQSCIAAKRLIVERRVRARFEELLGARIERLVTGDPRREETEIGPLAREDLRAALQRQVEGSVAAGARLALGGRIPDGPGWFYPPTLLVDVPAGAPAACEETFGPVAALFEARDAEDAIAIANRTEFGLGATLFTSSERGELFAPHIRAGSVFVNALVRSDPRVPFGGVAASGYGRELGDAGLLEFTQARTYWIA